MTLRYAVPLAFAALLLVALAVGLTRDPGLVPSPLVGRPVPEFALPPLEDRPGGRALGLSSADLNGEVSVVNVFASWCGPCRIEHPLLARLAREEGVAVHGINYKDKAEDAARWLAELGDPFTRVGFDSTGRVGVEWGVYGVPETFVVDREGRIAYKHAGPLTEDDYRETLVPLVRKLKAR